MFFVSDESVNRPLFKPAVMNKITLRISLRKPTLASLIKFILVFIILLSYSRGFSQPERVESRYINEIDVFLNGFSATASSESTHLKSLLNDLQPAAYFESGVVNVYGEQPNSLFTNPDSLSSLANANFEKQNIEIVTIRLSKSFDITRTIDLSVFGAFPKLKYVYILSAVENNPQNIIRKVQNIPSRLQVFYKIDLGS